MRGWKPRSPSPSLRALLFRQPDFGNRRTSAKPPTWQLVPWGLAVMLASLILSFRASLVVSPGRAGLRLEVAALSNQFYGAYLADGDHSRLNPPELPRIGWTNERVFFPDHPLPSKSGTNGFRD